MSARRLLVLVFLAAAACDPDRGGGGNPGAITDGGTGGGTGIALDMLAARTIEATCDRSFRCRSEGDAFALAVFGTEASCRELIGRSFEDGVDFVDLKAGVAAGRIRYDGNAAERCLAAISATCSQINPPDCSATFQGTVAAEGACFRDEECAGDSWCNNIAPTRADIVCPGMCTPRVGLGMACTTNRMCTHLAMGEAQCNAGVCNVVRNASEAAIGAMCGRSAPSNDTILEDSCADGAWCNYNGTERTGLCQSVPSPGATCEDSPDVCAAGESCFNQVCTPFMVRDTVGEACGSSARDLCSPVEDLICMNNTCQLVDPPSLGEACVPRAQPCDTGLFCDEMTNQCAQKRAAAAPCQSDDACAGGSCQDGQCLDRLCK